MTLCHNYVTHKLDKTEMLMQIKFSARHAFRILFHFLTNFIFLLSTRDTTFYRDGFSVKDSF